MVHAVPCMNSQKQSILLLPGKPIKYGEQKQDQLNKANNRDDKMYQKRKIGIVGLVNFPKHLRVSKERANRGI